MSIVIVPVVVPSSGDGPIANISALVGQKTVTLTGFFQGAYTLLASHNNNLFVPVLLFNSDGRESIKLTLSDAYESVRVRTMANTLGGTVTVTVAGVSKPGENLFATLATFAPGAGGTSAIVNTAILFPPTGLEESINFMCAGGLVGTMLVEGSNDGSQFNVIGSFQAGERQRPLVGLSQPLEFSPLSTGDNSRYLRFTIDGQISSTITATIGGRIPVSSIGPTPPGPTLMPTLPPGWGRYFFIDGDAGDDAHDGFIDAPLGTVFLPADAAAHAVQTTERLEAVTPMLGNAQSAIRLWKPRANEVTYDRFVVGDGRGRCDRRQLSGYSQFIDRGSDLTNSLDGPLSAGDRSQLGCVTDLNIGGPFTLSAVDPVAGNGATFTLMGAVLPDGFTLGKHRLKITFAAGGIEYHPVRWGDTTPAADPSIVTIWPNDPTTAVPGDTAVLEIPGANVLEFFDFLARPFYNDQSIAGYEAAGFTVSFNCEIGSDSAMPSRFAMFFTSTFSAASIIGSIVCDSSFIDEVGTFYGNNPSLVAGNGYNGSPMVESIEVHFGWFITSTLEASAFLLEHCTFQTMRLRGGEKLTEVAGCQHTGLSLQTVGHCEIGQLALLPSGNALDINPGSGAFTFPADQAAGSFSLLDLYDLDGIAPPNSAVIAHVGQYEIVWKNFGRRSGTGFRFFFSTDVTHFIDVTYASMDLTGFEVIGGVKLTVNNGPNPPFNAVYATNMLPCPRAMLAKYPDTEGPPFATPVAMVVQADALNQVHLANAGSGGLTFSPPLAGGFTVTNALGTDDGSGGSIGGFVLVSTDSTGGVLTLEPGSPIPPSKASSVPPTTRGVRPMFIGAPYPDTGAPLYVSDVVPGTVTPIPPQRGLFIGDYGPALVGIASQFGYDPFPPAPGTDLFVFVAWGPGVLETQIAQVSNGFDATTTVLANVPELYAFVLPGHVYRLKACVFVEVFGAGAGSRVAIDGAGVLTDTSNLSYTFIGISPTPSLAQAVALIGFGDLGGVVTEIVGNGYWLIEGSFHVTTAGGFVTVQFAQAVSNPSASIAEQGSYLEITLQK